MIVLVSVDFSLSINALASTAILYQEKTVTKCSPVQRVVE